MLIVKAYVNVKPTHFKKLFSDCKVYDFDDLNEYLHGRKNNERRDSITRDILLERKNHQTRFRNVAVNSNRIQKLDAIGIGSKKRRNTEVDRHSNFKQSDVGAGGFSHHLTSAFENWPIFPHVLPEVAFAGHTNSGKVTYFLALCRLIFCLFILSFYVSHL